MIDLNELQHVRRTTSSGVEILVLDTGSAINAEVEAMIQALQSRSNKGVEHHLEIVAKRGADKFMAGTYVNYGHKSIGDCGSVSIFIEGGSMLVAKAFQDWPLYNGQEGSTRYMDFSTQEFKNPLALDAAAEINEKWRSFYVYALPHVAGHLTQLFPRQDGEEEEKYVKAIGARAFDVMRGFLPAGSATKFSVHVTLRQASDELMRLRHHPLEEVREVALAVEDALKEKYPASFSHKRYEATEAFNAKWMRESYYFRFFKDPGFSGNTNNFHRRRLGLYRSTLESRPPKTELPKELAACGTIEFNFMLDFASFRDLQRHRAVSQRMPLLEIAGGFEEWYLNELPEDIRRQACVLLKDQENRMKDLNTTQEIKQYYTAMGYRTECEVVGSLPALVYLVELRATRFVHPTLRKRAQQMADYLEKEFGSLGLKIHLDQDPDRFDVKRGEHDIVMKV